MYQEHREFKRPENLNAKIWRFMDFAKFLSLLESSALWFSRVDKLGDPHEASWLPWVPPAQRKSGDVTDIFKLNYRWRGIFINTMAVSCWHMNEYESAAMWRLYTSEGQGIAVQSTFKALTECLGNFPEFLSVGVLTYLDYDRDTFPGRNNFLPFLHKRKSFEHEREVRAIAWPPGGADRNLSPIPDGLLIPVDLRQLIQSVYVSPTATARVRDRTEAIVQQYELGCPVHQSDLLTEPMF